MRRSFILLLLNAIAMAVVLVLIVTVPRGDRLLVVADPFAEDDVAVRVATAAGTPLVASGRTSFLAVVADDGNGAISRLFAAGAWLVLDGSFATSCLGTTS